MIEHEITKLKTANILVLGTTRRELVDAASDKNGDVAARIVT